MAQAVSLRIFQSIWDLLWTKFFITAELRFSPVITSRPVH
jgi:hypothetical protein